MSAAHQTSFAQEYAQLVGFENCGKLRSTDAKEEDMSAHHARYNALFEKVGLQNFQPWKERGTSRIWRHQLRVGI